jgi:hypothetical protein
MPLTGFELVIGAAILIGLPIAFFLLNRWRPRAGWWMLAAVLFFVILGNVLEKAMTGNSPLF